jgi:hypothetical protein
MHYNQEMRQCAILNSPEEDVRLIGVEYIISEKLFDTLSNEEKKLWHAGSSQSNRKKELEEVQMSSI